MRVSKHIPVAFLRGSTVKRVALSLRSNLLHDAFVTIQYAWYLHFFKASRFIS